MSWIILRPSEIPNLFKIFAAKEQRSSFAIGLEKCGDYLYINLLGSRKNTLLKVKEFDDYYITEDAFEKY